MMSTKTWQKIFSVFLLAGMLLSLAQPRTASAMPQSNLSNVSQAPSAPEPDEKALAKIEPQLLNTISAAGSSDFIARFTEQADLSVAYSMAWKERGEYVYKTLTETAARSQANAIEYLKARGVEYQSFFSGNDLFVKAGDLEAVTSLAALEEVASIRATRTYYIDPVEVKNTAVDFTWVGELVATNTKPTVTDPSLAAPQATTDWGIIDTNADDFWAAYGVQGEGILVANIDTGVQWDHPALVDSYKCGSDPTDPACWRDPSNICGATGACDNNGHGSHTMGTMVANDDDALLYIAGMAPDAQWIACKGCETNSCSDTALNACADWIVAPNGDPNNRPNIVNNSWGGGGGDNWYLVKVNAWRAAGIFPAFSAGNSGPTCGSAGSPGDYQESFASANHMSSRVISNLSSRGPSDFGHDPYTKPNISAPGSSICSTIPTNSWSCAYSGTSMASPHSAGAVALLWSCNPSLVGQIDETFQILQNSADASVDGGNCGAPPDGEGNYTYGYGYLNVLAAGSTVCGDSTLSGYVTEGALEAPGDPVVDALIQATDGVNIQNATSGADGYYSMMLFNGTYTVTTWAYGYEMTVIPDVVVNGATPLNINPVVAADYVISGNVSDSVTAAPLWATVEVDGIPIDPPVTVFHTDPDTGYYSMTLAGGQTYALTASALLHTSEVRDIGEPTGNQTQDFALVATSTNGGIAGYVTNYYTGDPIEDATVVVNSAGNPSATTDEFGYYQILEIAPGTYEATASADLYSPQTITGIVVQQSVVEFVEFELPTSHLVYAPEALENTLVWGTTDTESPGLVITNTGIGDLTFELVEQAGGFVPTGINAGEDVLVVRYDTTAATAMEAALTANGYTYLGVTAAQFEAMLLADVLAYKAVFYAGVAYAASQTDLIAYLDAGGSLYISDNDLGYSQGSTTFYQTYLQATYGADNGGDLLVGEDIMAGLDPDITADPYPDRFTVGAEGVQIFHFTTGATYAAGVFVDRMGYKAIYTSFDFDDIAAVADETELVARVLENIVGVPSEPFDWLTETPASGTVGAGLSADIQLVWDASVADVDQPGVYTATLAVVNNDPAAQEASIPVTMNVVPAATAGKLQGTVSTLGYCFANPAPVEEATVLLEGSLGYSFSLETDENGYYQRWLDAGESPYTVTVTMDGYETGTAIVSVTGGVTTTQDFVLTWLEPCAAVVPTALSVSVELGLSTNAALTITNDGGAALDFELVEKAGEYLPNNNVAAVNILLMTEDIAALDLDAYRTALTEAGYTWTERTTTPFPSAVELAAYDVLIWADESTLTPDNPECQIVADWLQSGDKALFVTSVDFMWDLANGTVGSGEYNLYMLFNTTYVGDYAGTGITVLNGVPGDEIGAGLDLSLAGTADSNGDYANNTVGAPTSFLYGTGGTGSGYSGFTYYEGSNYKTAWLGVNFHNGLNNQSQRNELLDRVMNFLGGGGDVTWLSESPITGTIPVAGDQLVDVVFDASVAEVPAPGTYTAELVVRSNDPINGRLSIPVEMDVTAPADWGELEGIVNTTGHCDTNVAPLEGATVFIESSDGYSFTAVTDASGYYHFWVDSDHNPITITVSADEHIGDSAVVNIIAGGVVTQDFDLRWLKPCVSTAPDTLEATVDMGATATLTLTIQNTGAVATDFTIGEQDGGYSPDQAGGESVPYSPDARTAPAVDTSAFVEAGTAAKEPVIGPASGGPAPEDIGDAWETMAPLPAGRVFNAVIADQNGYLYVIGGTSDAGGATPTNTNYRYDTAANTWATMTPMPMSMDSIDGIAIANKIYIPGDAGTADTYVYDIATDSWASIPANGGYTARSQYQVAAIGDDLYVLGGIVAAASASTTEVWVLDTVAGTWTAGVPMQNSRTSFSAGAFDGAIYVAGGVLFPGFVPDMTAEKFDGTAWSYIAGVPNGGGAYTRWSYNADGVGLDGLWLGAGRRDAGWAVLNHAGYYNPDTDTWTDSPTIPALAQGRVYMEGDVAADGYFYVIGGRDSAGAIVYNTNERLEVGSPVSADVPWLSEDPLSGTVDPDTGEVFVDVTMDSSVVPEPGVYFAFLKVRTDDPVLGLINVPVTMTVSPTSDYGLLFGTVTSQGYCDDDPAPLEGAEVFIEGSDGITYTVVTGADGTYSRWLPVDGNNYIVSVTAADHEFGIVSDVVIVSQDETQVDFDLRLLEPCVSAVPAALEVEVPLGYEFIADLAIANNGAVSADFELSEVEGTMLPLAADTTVLIVTPDSTGGDISLLLNTLALFPDLIVTVWDNADGNPTPADLAPYDVVLFGNDITWESEGLDKVVVGNAIADYIDAGGKGLEVEYVQSYDNWGFGGRYLTGGYSPFTMATLDNWNPDTLVIEEPDHPVMEGVTSLGDNFGQQDPGLAAGAVLLGTWSATGYNAIAVNENVVALNMNILHSADWTGDLGQLLYNAITWLAGGFEPVDVPWLAEDPITGTVPHDSSFPVDVTFTAFPTMTVGGVYTASLVIASNDPVNPEVVVPVTMHVVEPVYGVEVSADQAGSGEPGDVVTYTVTVTNTSNFATDTFTVTLGTYVYATTLSTAVVGPLAMGESATFVVSVTIPEDALDGDHDTVQITVTSAGDPTKTAITNVTTDVYVVIVPPDNYPVYLPLIWKVYP